MPDLRAGARCSRSPSSSDLCDVEVRERAAVAPRACAGSSTRRALPGALEHQHLEQLPVVAGGHSPLLVVVGDVGRVGRRHPRAASRRSNRRVEEREPARQVRLDRQLALELRPSTRAPSRCHAPCPCPSGRGATRRRACSRRSNRRGGCGRRSGRRPRATARRTRAPGARADEVDGGDEVLELLVLDDQPLVAELVGPGVTRDIDSCATVSSSACNSFLHGRKSLPDDIGLGVHAAQPADFKPRARTRRHSNGRDRVGERVGLTHS